ncbi:MAG: protein kinase, partial [Gemmatimonadales bacterium]
PELAAVIGVDRFLAEIKTTAHLQHPHILPLHDSGEVNGTVFYVMPFVEGESLRDRLDREKQLPIADAVRIATEVAGALDYAHRHGVIHRDIKPENILLHDGQAMVADFGIALAASRSDGSTRMTETGMSLGTPTYMSPEQAMGERTLDARTDVYALGCVLYEMLTAEPPFTGATAQAIVARVMTESPRDMVAQRATIPEHVAHATMVALAKLPADRFESARSFAEALARPGATSLATGVRVTRARPRGLRDLLPWALAAAGLALGAFGFLRPENALSTTRQFVSFGEGLVPTPFVRGVDISPDGSMIVVRDTAVVGRLWLKRRGELDAVPLAGTEGAYAPRFSRDGEWLSFIAGGRLKKIRLSGGAAITLADSADTNFGGSLWLDDGTILFIGPSQSTLSRVSASGGRPTVVSQDSALAGLGIGEANALPGGRGVMFTVCTSGCLAIAVHVLDLKSGKQHLLIRDALGAWYLPTGHVAYLRNDGVLMARGFDMQRLELTGPEVPLLEGIKTGGGISSLTFSATGTLIYTVGTGSLRADAEVVRVTDRGIATVVDSSWFGPFNSLALSPDGSRVAVSSGQANGALDIWVKTLDRGTFSRLTFGGQDRRPVWSPDGKEVAFVRDSGSGGNVYAKRVDGSTSERLLAKIDRLVQEVDWSPDGKWIVVRTDNGLPGAGDIVAVPASGSGEPIQVVATPHQEYNPAVSPDSRWLAYASTESGTSEVYVRPFPGPAGERWQVSNGGGLTPVWSRDGRMLYYLSPDGFNMRRITVQDDPTFSVVGRETLFNVGNYFVDLFHQSFALSPDGNAIYMLRAKAGQASVFGQLVLVDNWFTDVRARLKE